MSDRPQTLVDAWSKGYVINNGQNPLMVAIREADEFKTVANHDAVYPGGRYVIRVQKFDSKDGRTDYRYVELPFDLVLLLQKHIKIGREQVQDGLRKLLGVTDGRR